MLQTFLSLLRRFAYTAGLIFITFILTIGVASTVQWLYFDSGTIIDFLNTFQCNPYSDITTVCTLGRGSGQLKAIASDILLDQLPGPILTPWKIKLLYQTRYPVPAPNTERYTMVRKWALGWTDDSNITLDITLPQSWIPARSMVLIWIGSFILVAAVVVTVYCIVRIRRGNASLGEGQLIATHGRVEAWRGGGLGVQAIQHDDGDDWER